MSPMSRYRSPDGVPGADVAAYYRRRAEADVGLIVTEGVGIDHPAAVDDTRIPVMHGEQALLGWKRVVDEVHAVGGLIVPQLWHQGGLRDRRISKYPSVADLRPSGLWGPVGQHSLDPSYVARAFTPTQPITLSEIEDVIAAYARSAANARLAGFDGVALHGAHGYLIDSFLWGETNRRTDLYGGDFSARTRFAVEVVRAIRDVIGDDLPIIFRLSQHKSQNYDARLVQTPGELEALLTPLVDAGVDVFDVSARRFFLPAFAGSPLSLAGWVRKITSKPTIIVGSVGLSNALPEMLKDNQGESADNIPLLMEFYERGEFDLVGVGRALLADPQFARRLRHGCPFAPFDKMALKRLT